MYTFDTGKIDGILYNRANPILTTCGNTIRIRFADESTPFIETDYRNCLDSTLTGFASVAAFVNYWNTSWLGAGAGSGGGICTATATLVANSDTTISGNDFTPPINTEPSNIVVFLGGVKQNVGSVAYVLNGSVYDVIIGTTEEIVNAKINVTL